MSDKPKAKWTAALPDLRDLIVFSGLGLAGYGAWLTYEPAGFIVAGVGLFYLGIWVLR